VYIIDVWTSSSQREERRLFPSFFFSKQKKRGLGLEVRIGWYLFSAWIKNGDRMIYNICMYVFFLKSFQKVYIASFVTHPSWVTPMSIQIAEFVPLGGNRYSA
jgi:hypothetical protein